MTLKELPAKVLPLPKDSRLFSREWLKSLEQLETTYPISSDWINIREELPADGQYCEVAVLAFCGWVFREGVWDWDASDWYSDHGRWLLGLIPAQSQIAPILWRPSDPEILPQDY